MGFAQKIPFTFIFLLFLQFLPAVSSAQIPNLPFPQHTSYTAGSIKPNNVTQQQLDDSVRVFYDRWKAKYVKPGCEPDQYYVWDNEAVGGSNDSTICVSEGQGYGMLITAFMAGYDPGAKACFDGLYNYFRAHPTSGNPDLMAWRQVSGCIIQPDDHDSATDGDLDIAYGLLLADAQWGSDGAINYLQEATSVINAVMQDEIHPILHSVRLGNWATSSDAYYNDTRSSDFIINHFRAFEEATGDTNWGNVIDECYDVIDVMQTNYSPATGLLPDFIVGLNTGAHPASANYLESVYDGHYNWNACRVPWRLGIDYLLSGDPRALTALNKINAWIRIKASNDPAAIVAGYRLNGNNIANYQSLAFTAPFAVAAMSNSINQSWLNALWSEIVATSFSSEEYYASSLKLLVMIAVSGNWWTPESPRVISFSGYSWTVKNSAGQVGPGPNYFSNSPSRAWVDSIGQLHLTITKAGNKWYCTEVGLDDVLGHGRYVFQVTGNVGQLNENAVLGLFTWDDDPAEYNREVDIEFSRWGDSTESTSAQYVVQPYYHSGNLIRWVQPSGLNSSTHSFDWQADTVKFLSAYGHKSSPPYDSIMSSWQYTGPDIPSSGNAHARINLWLFQGTAPSDSQQIEVVISKFEFNPLVAPQLVEPLDNTSGLPVDLPLRWNAVPGATLYCLQLSTDSLWANTILDDSAFTGTEAYVGPLSSNTTYYWRVKAKNVVGSGDWSEGWRFTTGVAVTHQYPVSEGWNLVSVPLLIGDWRTTSVFPPAVSSAFAFNPTAGYTQSDMLAGGRGYWLKFSAATNVSITGLETELDSIPVSQGWNLIGSISYQAVVDSIIQIPDGIIQSSFYEYNGSYSPSMLIEPAKAYWVKSNADGVLVLRRNLSRTVQLLKKG